MSIRPLRSWEEFRACEHLQREVWGEDFSELAPASLLKIGQRLGGISSGAFTPDGEMIGFVFGLTGLDTVEDEDGDDGPGEDAGAARPVHWSHMLAVRAGHRDRGIGRRLKEHQRRRLLERGVEVMYWTYDPLVARNAHLNLNRLGAKVVEYVPNMYGETGSRLHRGLGTDRFVVAWRMREYPPEGKGRERPWGAALAGGEPVTVEGGALGAGQRPAAVRVEIPPDIVAIRDRDPEEGSRWRQRTRRAFRQALETGYRVVGFDPGPGDSEPPSPTRPDEHGDDVPRRPAYLLAREGS